MPAPQHGSRRIRVIVLFGLLLLLGVFAFTRFSVYHDLTALRDQGIPAPATITKLDNGRHEVTYEFTASGRMYTGSGRVNDTDGGPPFASLRVGAEIGIVFLPTDPNQSLPGNPTARIVAFEAGIALTVGVVFLAGIALIYGFFFVGGRKGLGSWK